MSLKQWLKIFGEHYQQAITETNAAAYVIGLRDLKPQELDYACEKALRECEFIPKVADIRNRIPWQSKVSPVTAQMIALEMYDKTLSWLRATDANPKASTEELPPIAEYAMKAAGGREAMLSAKTSDAEWARKHFIENYERLFTMMKEQGISDREQVREALGLVKSGVLDFKALAAGSE